MAATTQFSEHLAPELREIIGTRLGGRESWYSRVLTVEKTDKPYEDYLYAAGLPIAVEKPQGEDIQSFDPLEGGKMRFSSKVYAIGAEITEEMDDDDQYKGNGSALDTIGSGISDALAEVVEIQAHRFFGAEGFATSAVPAFMRTLPDNSSTVSIFNTAHGPISGGEAPAQANRPSTDVDLTLTAFRAALTQFRKYVNDRNLKVPAVSYPNRILVHPDGEFDAREIINNPMRPDTMNPVKNVTAGAVEIVVDPYMPDSDAWIMLAPKHWLTFLWRKRPYMDNFDDKRARVGVFVGLERFALIAPHWLGTYGSKGA